MAKWPDGWRESTLRQAGLTPSPFALKAMSAWRDSTPVTPQMNNPVGMPAKGWGAPAYLNTPYALFQSMPAFRAAFATFLSSNHGKGVFHALDMGESLAAVYREVHALQWPARHTETDWPAAILDLVVEKYRSKLATTAPADRKTTGLVQARPDVHDAVRQQAFMLHHAAKHISDTSQAIAFIVKGLG